MTKLNRRRFLEQGAIVMGGSIASRTFCGPFVSAFQTRPRTQDHPFFAGIRGVEVIAHRGGNGHWPGETMYAMQKAREIGADVLEMDVYLTKDKELVLMHDVRTSKTTEKHALINSLKLAEVQQLSAAYKWSQPQNPYYKKKFGELPSELKNVLRVPSLREIFEAFKEMRMVIEMKLALHSPVSALVDLIREYRMQDKVLIASFVHEYLKKFRAQQNDVATSASAWELIRYLRHQEIPNASALQITPEITATILHDFKVTLPVLTPERVKQAHDDKLKVHVWTINDRQKMDRMIKMGVDGIITDYPCTLLDQLGRRPAGSPLCVFSPT